MIHLYQFPWSPFCIVIRNILEFGRIPHKIINIPNSDRQLIWKLTRGRYYQVPVIKDGRNVIFETSEHTQIIAKYLDNKFQLGLFPEEFRGIQTILWQWIESRVEGPAFKLNDIYYQEYTPKKDQLGLVRHKERKFGRGCIELWQAHQDRLMDDFASALLPFDQMLLTRPYLLTDRPVFVDFDLQGMIANFLYSGHYLLPSEDHRLSDWYKRMHRIKRAVTKREKLHS